MTTRQQRKENRQRKEREEAAEQQAKLERNVRCPRDEKQLERLSSITGRPVSLGNEVTA